MLEQKVEGFLKRHSIPLIDKTIVIGLSGGPDSLTLLHYLWKKQGQWNMRLIAAHVDHMFRGEQSYSEAIFVQQFCEQLKIPIEWKQINVKEYMKRTGKSAQVSARECRYEFFQTIMEKYHASYLALGHHGDDQIETILMRMTRGSSGQARAGIPVTRPFATGEIIRPLLAVNKDEIEEYCQFHQLFPRRDPSNNNPIYKRNRFRKEMIPFLKKENPLVHEQFQRISEELIQDESFLMELTANELNKVLKSRDDQQINLHIEKFLAMPLSLQRRAIQLILNYLYMVRPSSLSALHIDLVMALLRSPHPSGRLDFPEGLQIIRSYQLCEFLFEKAEEKSYSFELKEPGTVKLPNGHFVSLAFISHPTEYQGLNSLILNPEKTVFPIVVRTRQKGDRIQPKGMSGTKKIKDIFIDHKIPKLSRANWPIITDGDERVLWVPQLKKSIYEASHEVLDRYLLLTYKT